MTSVHPLDRLRVGMRAVVRHRLDDGLSDALGEVVALDDSSVSVATRRGVRVVPRGAVVAAKEVPPAPSRRGAAHLAPSMGDLQRVMVEGWPPTERAALGGWMLRAAGSSDRQRLVDFLDQYAATMPRVMLRNALEHFDKEQRTQYMNLKKVT